MPESMYYDVNKTLSRQRLFNFVVGPRGAGKTYGAKQKAMENWLNKGEQFVYLRRYNTEMPSSQMKNFFTDVQERYPGHEWTCQKGVFRCDKDIIGWYFPLSKAQMLKSIPFPKVSLIIFDEFIINTGMYHYLQNEVTNFLEAYSTISRDRDIPVLFLSNSVTFSNPYFLYFDLTLEEGQKVKLKGDISLEYVENKAFTDHMKSTRFGKLLEGTRYADYAIENKFLLDTETFIEKMPRACNYLTTFVFDNMETGLYRDMSSGVYYLSESVDHTCKYRVAVTSGVHDTNTMLLSKTNLLFKSLIDAYSEGLLRFETMAVKNAATKILKGVL